MCVTAALRQNTAMSHQHAMLSNPQNLTALSFDLLNRASSAKGTCELHKRRKFFTEHAQAHTWAASRKVALANSTTQRAEALWSWSLS